MNICKCYKITTKSNEIFAFTSASQNMVYNEVLYISFVTNEVQIKTDNVIISNIIVENIDDFVNANVEVFILKDNEKINVMDGHITNISHINNIFTANVKGLKSKINKTIGTIYSPFCRAEFCDNKCTLNKENYIGIKCDKSFKNCCEIGNNLNFRGEPYLYSH
ncbi:MAG: DUF2163 domain-containing protein [Rickettsiales bacterium]|jgi:hypothetical protein|nr:DUF2163 domain-containing protein [Rickettsiales bacterium]